MDEIQQLLQESVNNHQWTTLKEAKAFLKTKGHNISTHKISKNFKLLGVNLYVDEGVGVVYRTSDLGLRTFDEYLLSHVNAQSWEVISAARQFLGQKNIHICNDTISNRFKLLGVNLYVDEGAGLVYRTSDLQLPTLEGYLKLHVNNQSWVNVEGAQAFLLDKGVNVTGATILNKFQKIGIQKYTDKRYKHNKVYRYRKHTPKDKTATKSAVNIDPNDKVLQIIIGNVNGQFWTTHAQAQKFLKSKGINVVQSTISNKFRKAKISLYFIENIGIFYRTSDLNLPTLKEYLNTHVDLHNWRLQSEALNFLSSKGIKISLQNISAKFISLGIRLIYEPTYGDFVFRSKEFIKSKKKAAQNTSSFLIEDSYQVAVQNALEDFGDKVVKSKPYEKYETDPLKRLQNANKRKWQEHLDKVNTELAEQLAKKGQVAVNKQMFVYKPAVSHELSDILCQQQFQAYAQGVGNMVTMTPPQQMSTYGTVYITQGSSALKGGTSGGEGSFRIVRNPILDNQAPVVRGPGSVHPMLSTGGRVAGAYIGIFMMAPQIYRDGKVILSPKTTKVQKGWAALDIAQMGAGMWAFGKFVMKKHPQVGAGIMMGTAAYHGAASIEHYLLRPYLQKAEFGQTGQRLIFTNEQDYFNHHPLGPSCTDGRKPVFLNKTSVDMHLGYSRQR